MSIPARPSAGADCASSPEHPTGDDASRIAQASPTRRRLLVGGAAAVAASAAAAVVAQPASAANGSAVIAGKANTATAGTSLTSATTVSAVTVTNTSSGPGATLASTSGHGGVQTTRSANMFGTYAWNRATTTGLGAALLASGGVNTGIWAATAGVGVSALRATHSVPEASANGNEAAVTAVGAAANGVVATTSNVDMYALASAHTGGGVASFGASDGGIGVFGVATAGGSGLWGRADDGTSYALTADGTALFLGDVVVQGTLYAPTVVNTLPPGLAGDGAVATTSSGRRLAARAAKKAAQLRAQLG